MKTSAEMKIEISNARISNANAIVMPDGTCKLKFEVEMATQKHNNENANDESSLIKASRFSLKDDFMRHAPKDDCILIEASKLSLKDDFIRLASKGGINQERFHARLTKVIQRGIDDFYRPILDPSFVFDPRKEFIISFHYRAGEKPAMDKSYNWWKKMIKDSKWCFGTKSQYIAFLGVLIKMLIAKGWTAEKALKAVCDDSAELGHYSDSENANYGFETTGSREVCGIFDLGNTNKHLVDDEDAGCLWIAGGHCGKYGSAYPLADLRDNKDYDFPLYSGVPWFVLKK